MCAYNAHHPSCLLVLTHSSLTSASSPTSALGDSQLCTDSQQNSVVCQCSWFLLSACTGPGLALALVIQTAQHNGLAAQAAQDMDWLFVGLFGKTCGLQLLPSPGEGESEG